MIDQSTKSPLKRAHCPRCSYVQKNCLCAAITEQACRTQIVILQHPTETKHSKNTAKLVNLCIEHCRLVVGEQPADFAQLNLNKIHTYLIYPSEQAQPIEKLTAANQLPLSQRHSSSDSSQTQPPITLIFIDASWRKAYRIWQQNPWLQQLPNITFTNAPKTRYQIRKHKRETSLSTIEAVAYCLQQLENADTSVLFNAFDALIAMHNRYRPS